LTFEWSERLKKEKKKDDALKETCCGRKLNFMGAGLPGLPGSQGENMPKPSS